MAVVKLLLAKGAGVEAKHEVGAPLRGFVMTAAMDASSHGS